MTLARRIARLEVGLPPTEAVLLWLAEAHAHGSLPAYAAWLVDHPEMTHPLDRIREQVTASARGGLRRADRDEGTAAVRRAVGHACYLFALVLRIDVATDDLLRVEGPRIAVLAEWRRTSGDEAGPWRTIASDIDRVLDDHERARRWLELEHLDGRVALFPDTASAWSALTAQAHGLAGDRHGSTSDDARPSGVADLDAAARCDALDLMGQGLSAATIAGRRLRAA